jgi:hypothetical protein
LIETERPNLLFRYLPAQIQTQAGEAIKGIIPKKEMRKFDDCQKKIFERINKVILGDDGVPDILSRIKQTRNLVYSGEFLAKGAMFSIIDPKMALKTDGTVMGGDSPSRSEIESVYSHSKTNMSKKMNEIEKIDQTMLVKNLSNFSRPRGHTKQNASISIQDGRFGHIGDYGPDANTEIVSKKSRKSMKNATIMSPEKDATSEIDQEEDNELFPESQEDEPNSPIAKKSQKSMKNKNDSLADIADHSEADIESLFFGKQGPKVDSMELGDIARIIFSYMKIQGKKRDYAFEELQKEIEKTESRF